MISSERASSLGITDKQMGRLCKRYKVEGAKDIVHRNRGCKASNAIAEKLKETVVKLFTDKYSDCNLTYFREKLKECESIIINPLTVGHILRTVESRSKNDRKSRRAKKT